MAKHQVAIVSEIPVGGRKIVEVAGRSIGVFNIGGEFFALRNTCPHQGGALCAGQLSGFLMADVPGNYTYTRRGEILRCPWHGWEFDVKTGQSWVDPEKTRVRTYSVSVEAIATDGGSDGRSDDLSDECNAGSEPVADPETGRSPGPFQAETYAVSVEQQVIFVEI